MNAENWQKVKSILADALEIAPPNRAAFLEKSCRGDFKLRAEIESLLEFESDGFDPLENSAETHLEHHFKPDKNPIGRSIGKYKILSEIGSGGMGAVYLVMRDDGEFSQKAALKLIKRGMDSDAVLRRFFNERQILASLEHPNIARLIDGGTTDDELPFFVMEFVEGATILDYSDAENLDLEARLNLFREVCAAVSFAHQNLIIHRDLKPSNILVTRDGKVKLLDFGIAKLLKSDEENQTATRNFIFTPEYASPEQVKGENLTTASDVYSLGVILYELLTGNRPYKTDSKNIGDIIKSVCETLPEKPSSVVSNQPSVISQKQTDENKRQKTKDKGQNTNPKSKIQNPKSLRGDLDNIILKALRKEPERRYSSVEQLSEDIRRHLDGLPVSAIKDSWKYRTAKFLRRNRVAAAFAALVVLVLFAGISGTTWQAIRAEKMRAAAEAEKMRAERRSENLRKISNSLVTEIERAIRDLPGSLPARQILLARAVEQLDALALESEGDTDLQLELVWAYQNLADLPDKKLSERTAIHQKALLLMEKVIASGKTDSATRDRLAMLYLDMLVNSRLRGDADFTLEYNTKAVAIVERLLREEPGKAEYLDSFWTANYHYALTLMQLGKAREVIETGRKILPAAETLHDTNPPGTDKYNFMKPHLTRLAVGSGLNYLGEYEAALAELQKALDECRAEQKLHPDQQILRRNEANILSQIAMALESRGDFENGLVQAKNALSLREKIAAQTPTDLISQMLTADGEFLTGQMLARNNQASNAVPYLRRALEIYEKINAKDEERVQTKLLAAAVKTNLGDALVKTGKTPEGLKFLRESLTVFESVNAAQSIDANLQSCFAHMLKSLADAVRDTNPTEARNLYERSFEVWNNLQKNGTIKKSDTLKMEEVSRRL